MDKYKVVKLEIGKLELKSGDILVMKAPPDVTVSEIANMVDNLRELLPDGIKGMVLWDGTEISVISKDTECPTKS